MTLTWGSDDVTFDGSKPKKDVISEEKKPEIVEEVKTQPEHEVLFEHPFIKVKSSKGYVYSERKGVDSVAFILLANNASDERRIGLIREFKPPVGSFIVTAFGGSIDSEKYENNLKKLVVDEVIEEAGFNIIESDVKSYGKVFVSSKSNQFCHLFAVVVDKLKQVERTTTDPLEKKSSVTWITLPEVFKLEDWKAIAIITKRLSENNFYTSVRNT